MFLAHKLDKSLNMRAERMKVGLPTLFRYGIITFCNY